MPLLKRPTSQARSKNIEELVNHGYPQKQASAIAHDVQRKAAYEKAKAQPPTLKKKK